MLAQFERQWESGSTPNVKELVSEFGPLAPEELAHLLLVDQSYRCSRGTPQSAAVYFEQFPELLNCAEAAIDLLYAEFLQREANEPELTVEQFIQPYPQLEDEFRRQVSFHRSVFEPALADASYSESIAEPAQSVTSSDAIPGYEILGELGRGGLGVVYLARDVRLNRHVALKMLLAGRFASDNLPKRLWLEAETTARLQHPNIVQIFEVSQHAGHPFLALEYISGGTLADWMERRPQAPGDAARIVRDVARAIQFAHDKGVIHRDLKPSNLLLQPLSNTSSNSENHSRGHALSSRMAAGRLGVSEMLIKVADFGLAKLMEASTSASAMPATLSGDLVGTVAYMSPEQACAGPTSTSKRSGPLTVATDVYSLGAILYELLTGRPPFVGVQPLEVLAQVVNDEPIRPSQLVRPLPRDLQTICLKCLEKNPKRRYATAAALADDLERYLSGQPILGRHASRFERFRRWCRRNPMKTATASLVAGMLVMIATISILYSMMLGNQLALITQSQMMEKSLKTQALDLAWESSLSQADALRSSHLEGQRFASLKAIDTARALASSMDFTPSQIDRMRNATIAALAQSDISVTETLLSREPKAARLMSMDNSLEIGAYLSDAGETIVQRIKDGVELARIAGCDKASIVELSRDGTKLAIVNKQCRIYDVAAQGSPLLFESSAGGSWTFSCDGRSVVGADQSGQLQIVDLSDPSSLRSIGCSANPKLISLSPDAQMIAMWHNDSVEVVQCASGKVLFRVPAPRDQYQSFEWHPSSQMLAIGPYNHGIELWDIKGYRLFYLPISGPAWFRFDRRGSRLLAYNLWSESLNLWNIYDRQLEFTQTGRSYSWLSNNSEDGFDLLEKVNEDSLAKVKVTCASIYTTLPALISDFAIAGAEDLAYSPDGSLLAYTTRGQLDIFDARSLTSLLRETVPGSYVRFAPDGSLLTLTEFKVGDQQKSKRGLNRWAKTIKHHSGSLSEIVFGPPEALGQLDANFAIAPFTVATDNALVAIARYDGVQLWSLNQAKTVQSNSTHSDVRRVSMSTDGKRVATGGWNGGNVCIWDTETGQLQHTIHEANNCAVQYSPDGQQLAVVSDEIKVWDAQSWQLQYKFSVTGGPNNGVSVCFSPNGRTLATSDSYGRIHLLDAKKGQEYMVLTGPSKTQINQLIFSPDGSQIAVLSGGQTAAIWHLDKLQAELHVAESLRDSNPKTHRFESRRDSATWNDSASSSTTSAERIKVGLVFDERFRQLEAGAMIQQAILSAEQFQFEATKYSIARALELHPQDPAICNNLAWFLATGPVETRNPQAAIELAETAMKNVGESKHSLYANTLGVAQYRAGLYRDALATLKISLANQPPSWQAFDLYFLAMCSAQLHDQEAAQKFFDQAAALKDRHRATMSFDLQAELLEFHREAESLLEKNLTKN